MADLPTIELYDVLSPGDIEGFQSDIATMTTTSPRPTHPVTTTLEYVKIVGELATPTRGTRVTRDASTGAFTAEADGTYKLHVYVSAEFQSGDQVQFFVTVNGVPSPTATGYNAQGRGTGKPVPLGFTGYVEVSAGDVISFAARVKAGTSNLVIASATISLELTGY